MVLRSPVDTYVPGEERSDENPVFFGKGIRVFGITLFFPTLSLLQTLK